ncbi:radical SAM protein [Streptomyces sp. V2]|uniref:B12-binding domain-containing radical SAM protein n=1 Tax=Streptomyces niveiscabiei TaxID=164115 RepID=A0ABW9I8H6_9ACTN|nr:MULTISPECIES: radical SAM protein [Streptomyces]PWG14138.1 radical SAM protein [Streptomyces sp. V2]
MTDVVLLTPREIATGTASLNNQNVMITDEEYVTLDPALRIFYEKVRENLGLACITGYLRNAGYSVKSLNLHGRTPSDEAIIDLIRRERPRFIGISIMYDLHIIDAIRLIRCARIAHPEALVAIGGAFCTYNAKLIAEQVPEADCVAFGEGELTLVGIMDRLSAGVDWRQTPGLYYRDGDRIRTSGMPVLPDLSQMVWPARDLLEAHRAAGIPTPVASTFTSRGCHAKCTFCYAPRQPGVVDGFWRMRPPGDVVDEIEYLQREFGTRFIWFNDDNFGGAFSNGFAHAVEFAETVLQRGLKFQFHCEFRVDSGLIDHEALDLLHRAGLASALLGIESGSPGMLRRFKKGTTVSYNLDAARMFKRKGLGLDPGWIMIEPKTSLDELWENLGFIVAAGIHKTDNPFFLINRAIALRGTEMYDKIEEPLIPADIEGLEGAAFEILRTARRDYQVPDPRVEALWAAWSLIGEEISDRKENVLPFVAQKIALAARLLRGTTQESPRGLLSRLRAWRNGLPELFLTFINYGLVLADGNPPNFEQRLVTDLRKLLSDYDTQHLGSSFEDFTTHVQEVCRTADLVPGRAGR